MFVRQTMGHDGDIEMRLLPNEVKRKITRDEAAWRETML
jgi:hypothetical protein